MTQTSHIASKENEKKKLCVSFSGGRTSAFMTWWLLNEWKDRDNWEIIIVFANTGKEREETLKFINDCDNNFGFNVHWVEYRPGSLKGWSSNPLIVNYDTASRNGEPFQKMISKIGIPSQNAPFCSQVLKRNTIKAYLKKIKWKKPYMAIGIRSDEMDRINSNWRKEKIIYPLISFIPTTKNDINAFWNKQSFDLRLKSYEGNCDLCWKKSFRKLYTILQENPQLADWWLDMEEKYKNFIPESRKNNNVSLPVFMYRKNTSIKLLIEQSQKEFLQAQDESKIFSEYKQLSLFDLEEFGCSESCEVF